VRTLRMSIFLVGTSLALSVSAAELFWRATGQVTSVLGDTSLLPLPAAPGNAFIIDFSYDEFVADAIPSLANIGSYPITGMTVTIGANSLNYVGPGIGPGRINIQATTFNPNVWGVSGNLGFNSELTDAARVNLFFPPNTILSDVLTPPPSSAGATVQFGLFSRDYPGTAEAFVIASLASVVQVIAGDADADGVLDVVDNCISVPNGPLAPDAGGNSQLDSNGDGFGNLCDADLNSSGLVTSADFAILRSVLNQNSGVSPVAADADLNGSGTVTTADFAILRARLNSAPGPSGLVP
jgi:Dockerin type I domain